MSTDVSPTNGIAPYGGVIIGQDGRKFRFNPLTDLPYEVPKTANELADENYQESLRGLLDSRNATTYALLTSRQQSQQVWQSFYHGNNPVSGFFGRIAAWFRGVQDDRRIYIPALKENVATTAAEMLGAKGDHDQYYRSLVASARVLQETTNELMVQELRRGFERDQARLDELAKIDVEARRAEAQWRATKPVVDDRHQKNVEILRMSDARHIADLTVSLMALDPQLEFQSVERTLNNFSSFSESFFAGLNSRDQEATQPSLVAVLKDQLERQSAHRREVIEIPFKESNPYTNMKWLDEDDDDAVGFGTMKK